jgi:hypothetical protein
VVRAWKKARQWMEYGEIDAEKIGKTVKNKNIQNKQKRAIQENTNPAKQNTKGKSKQKIKQMKQTIRKPKKT